MSEPRLADMEIDEVAPDLSRSPGSQAAVEVISLDTMRSSIVANFENRSFEQEDLDVPAFLRKRGEVM